MAQPDDDYLTKEQAAEYLGVSHRTIRTWLTAGRFPKPTNLDGQGNRHYWHCDELTAFKDRREQARKVDEPKPVPATVEPEDQDPPPGVCTYRGCTRPQHDDGFGLHLCTTHTKRAHTILNRRIT